MDFMTKELIDNHSNISSRKYALAAAEVAVLPHTCGKEMSSEYRVAAQPLGGRRNKHHY